MKEIYSSDQVQGNVTNIKQNILLLKTVQPYDKYSWTLNKSPKIENKNI